MQKETGLPSALIFVAPEPGVVNHCIALGLLLHDAGAEVRIVTAPEMRSHVERLGVPFPLEYVASHSVDFDRGRPGRLPHMVQLCNEAFLQRTLDDQLALVDRYQPDVLITPHYFSIPFASELAGRPFVTYYTDGAAYLIRRLHPRAHLADKYDLTRAVERVARSVGATVPDEPVPFSLESPYLNVVRGLPATTELPPDVQEELPDSVVFAGLLTYDGAPSAADAAALERWSHEQTQPIVSLTFGTISRDHARYRTVMAGIRRAGAAALVASYHVPIEALETATDDVFVRQYIPNAEALRVADAVVHHGGHGTFLSAVAAGTPQVIVPDNVETSSQGAHCRVVTRLGIGVCLADSACSEESVAAAIADALARCRRRARELATAVRGQDHEARTAVVERIRALRGDIGAA